MLRVSNYIGVIFVVETGEVRVVFNPDYDAQLEDRNLLRSTVKGETLAMLRLERANNEYGVFGMVMTPGDCAVAVRVAKERIAGRSWRKSS